MDRWMMNGERKDGCGLIDGYMENVQNGCMDRWRTAADVWMVKWLVRWRICGLIEKGIGYGQLGWMDGWKLRNSRLCCREVY